MFLDLLWKDQLWCKITCWWWTACLVYSRGAQNDRHLPICTGIKWFVITPVSSKFHEDQQASIWQNTSCRSALLILLHWNSLEAVCCGMRFLQRQHVWVVIIPKGAWLPFDVGFDRQTRPTCACSCCTGESTIGLIQALRRSTMSYDVAWMQRLSFMGLKCS